MNAKNEKTKDEEMVDYALKQLEESLICMYDNFGEEEQHAFDLGEMYGMIKMIKAAKKEV